MSTFHRVTFAVLAVSPHLSLGTSIDCKINFTWQADWLGIFWTPTLMQGSAARTLPSMYTQPLFKPLANHRTDSMTSLLTLGLQLPSVLRASPTRACIQASVIGNDTRIPSDCLQSEDLSAKMNDSSADKKDSLSASLCSTWRQLQKQYF
jgi:hypothetical protein